MTVLLDAAPLVALANRNDRLHTDVVSQLQTQPGPFVIPAPVTAEADYLLGRRLGRAARLRLLEDLAAGRFAVAALEAGDYAAALELEARYADLDLGLADCAVVLLAQRVRTTLLLTFDERHFRTVTPLQGGTFTLLPADA